MPSIQEINKLKQDITILDNFLDKYHSYVSTYQFRIRSEAFPSSFKSVDSIRNFLTAWARGDMLTAELGYDQAKNQYDIFMMQLSKFKSTQSVMYGNSFELTPLFVAAYEGQKEAVLAFLAYGADPNEKNNFNGRWATALYMAAAWGYHEIVEVLVNIEGIDLFLGSSRDDSALTEARKIPGNRMKTKALLEGAYAKSFYRAAKEAPVEKLAALRDKYKDVTITPMEIYKHIARLIMEAPDGNKKRALIQEAMGLYGGMTALGLFMCEDSDQKTMVQIMGNLQQWLDITVFRTDSEKLTHTGKLYAPLKEKQEAPEYNTCGLLQDENNAITKRLFSLMPLGGTV